MIKKPKSDDRDLEAGRRLKKRAGSAAVSRAKKEKEKQIRGRRRGKRGRKIIQPSVSGPSGSGTDSEDIFERSRRDPPMMTSNLTLAGDAAPRGAPTAGQRKSYKRPPPNSRVKDFANDSAVCWVDPTGGARASDPAQSRASAPPPRTVPGRGHDGFHQQKDSPLSLAKLTVEHNGTLVHEYNEYKKEKRERTADRNDERKATEPRSARVRGRSLERQLYRRKVLRRAEEDIVLQKFSGRKEWEDQGRTRSRPRARSWFPPRTRQRSPGSKEKKSIWQLEFWLAASPFALEAIYHLAEPKEGWEKYHKDKDAGEKKKRDQAKSSRRHRENPPRRRAWSIDGSDIGRSQRQTMLNEGRRTDPGPNLTAGSQRRGSVRNGPITRPVRMRGGIDRFVNFEEEAVSRYEVSADGVKHVRGLGLIFC